MITDRNIKIIFQIIFLTTLGIYIFIGELPNLFFELKEYNINLFWIFKIFGILLSSFMILSSFKWKFILKPLLGRKYIAGIYEGYSQKKEEEKIEKEHSEKIEISQTMLSTTITGTSHDEIGNFYSSWTGKLVDVKGDTFKFLIYLNTQKKESSAILTLNIDNLSIKGFGISLEVGNKKKWIFNLKKK